MTQEQLDALLTEDLAALDTEEMEIPESFRTGWRQAVEEEAQMMKPSWPKKAILRMCSLAAALVFVVGGTLLTRDQLHLDSAPQEENGMVFTSRTSAKMAADYDGGGMMLNSTYGAVEEAAYEMAVNDTIALGAAANTLPQPETEKKIIRTIDISLTTTNFEGDLAAVQALCESLGGWVEYIYQYGDTARGELRWGNLTLRIPSGQLVEQRRFHSHPFRNSTFTTAFLPFLYYNARTYLQACVELINQGGPPRPGELEEMEDWWRTLVARRLWSWFDREKARKAIQRQEE